MVSCAALFVCPSIVPRIIQMCSLAIEQQSHEAWERMRLHATLTIQPHVKGRLTPMRLLPFPWETTTNAAPAPQLSKEEARARLLKLMQRKYPTIQE